MFHFSDRPFGGRFIAVCAADQDKALAKALEVAGGGPQGRGLKWDGDLYMCDTPESSIEDGAYVSGGHQE
jgi:hypothetical protein